MRTLAEPRGPRTFQQLRQQGRQSVTAQSGHALRRHPTNFVILVVQGVDQRRRGKRIGDAAQGLGRLPAGQRPAIREHLNECPPNRLPNGHQGLAGPLTHHGITACQIAEQRRNPRIGWVLDIDMA